MSKVYEGLFIFPEALDETGLDQAIERVKEELEKLIAVRVKGEKVIGSQENVNFFLLSRWK